MSDNQENQNQELSSEEIEKLVAAQRARQSIGLAIVGGLLGALLGAAIWAGITAATHFQIGWMAVGVGVLVGFLVRILGKGVDITFGIIGAVFALVGCLLGNAGADIITYANANDMSFMDALSEHSLSDIVALVRENSGWIDLLFYAIAVYEGFQFSINRIRG